MVLDVVIVRILRPDSLDCMLQGAQDASLNAQIASLQAALNARLSKLEATQAELEESNVTLREAKQSVQSAWPCRLLSCTSHLQKPYLVTRCA
jgi:hypothetical protein